MFDFESGQVLIILRVLICFFVLCQICPVLFFGNDSLIFVNSLVGWGKLLPALSYPFCYLREGEVFRLEIFSNL